MGRVVLHRMTEEGSEPKYFELGTLEPTVKIRTQLHLKPDELHNNSEGSQFPYTPLHAKRNRSASAIVMIVVVVAFIVLIITVNLLVLGMLWITHYKVLLYAQNWLKLLESTNYVSM